jgi:predicted amidohydrolase
MKLTVCQLHNARDAFAADWDRLVAHVKSERSDLVLLPEMPFFTWFPIPREFDGRTWRAAVAAHDAWEQRLSELTPAITLGTRPVDFGALRYSAGFMWKEDEGMTETIHVKSCLANEEGSWETTWYERAVPEFESATVGAARVGMLIGLELWMSGQAESYGADGVHIVAVPRVDRSTNQEIDTANNEWLEGGRRAASASGAYCISSTRGGPGNDLGGAAWIIAPDGRTLALTSNERPFVSVEVDLNAVSARLGTRRHAPRGS